jgi:hydrogenase expression/formation protein HypC
MCLAVPGRVLEVDAVEPEFRTGSVDFAGVKRQVNLAFTPEVRPGQYVLVHAGFALQVIDEEEAAKTFQALKDLGELEESLRPEEGA